MNEKLTDRLGLVSLFLTTLLFFAQIINICAYNEPSFTAHVVLFIAYNICAATFFALYLSNDRKILKVLHTIRATAIVDIVMLVACLVAFGIKMLVI
jgi:hypothetical protein